MAARKDQQTKENIIKRFAERYIPEPNSGCWLWIGKINTNRYGKLNVRKKETYAHRFSFELFIGIIPNGMVIDHKCCNTYCVNPEHLQVVTRPQNNKATVERGRNYKPPAGIRPDLIKQSCKRGHAYIGNVYITGNGAQVCKICQRFSRKRWKERHKLNAKFK